MRKLLFIAPLLFLCACQPKALSTLPTNNQELKVEIVGSFDGCTVYRFIKDHYFVRCSGTQTVAYQTRSCGKACVTQERVQTDNRP